MKQPIEQLTLSLKRTSKAMLLSSLGFSCGLESGDHLVSIWRLRKWILSCTCGPQKTSAFV